MREITLNEYLSHDNPWTARLLGYEQFQKKRDITQIVLEYDRDCYGKRLADYQKNPQKFKMATLYGHEGEIFASIGNRIFKMPYSAYVGIKRSKFLNLLNRFGCSGELCELGAGNGQNHLWLMVSQDRPVYGGEYSQNAINLAKMLCLEVQPFNFYVMEDYRFIRPGSTIFTFHAIEQIPDATCVIAGLKSQREKIELVIHFEPLYRKDRKDLLGILRNRYAEINDYNCNLLKCLQEDPEIVIEYLEQDFLGNNPLNPASITAWRFR